MEEIIHVPKEQSETGNLTEYTESVVECFDNRAARNTAGR